MQIHQDSPTAKINKRKKPVHRTQEEWQALINQSYESHLTAKAFCHHQQISLSNFYYWRKNFKALSLRPSLSIYPKSHHRQSKPTLNHPQWIQTGR